LFVLGFFVVVVKLVTIQVRDHAKYEEIARMQYESREVIHPSRGLIYDRNRSILVSNITEYTIACDPSWLKKQDSVRSAIAVLAPILPVPKDELVRKLSDSTRKYTILMKNAPEEIGKKCRALKFPGIITVPTPKRRYHFQTLAGQVIGYTSNDYQGMSGIEKFMNKELAGQEGYIVYQRNASGFRRPDVEYPSREPVNGRSVVLTIDQVYQSIAEEELARGVEKYTALSGRCIILQPRTGEVLAMANYPSIDPNRFYEYDYENARNKVVTDLYEPGSTFKVVAMSAALNEGLYGPDDKVDGGNGCWNYDPPNNPIIDEHKLGMATLREAFEYSSNVIHAKLADKVGAETFYKYARNFGFGVKTGIELPGEHNGDLKKPVQWSGATLKYMGFGYGVAVTALQIACAYAAIANDGLLMRPMIRKWLIDSDRNIIDEQVPQVVRRVVSAKTAATMKEFMQGVVDHGTAQRAKIAGINVAGKTGTTQRYLGGNYSSTSHIASFVGFFPVEDPKILILVIVDAPQGGSFGGIVSAPIFRDIAMRIINSSNEFARKPEKPVYLAADSGRVTVPGFIGMAVNNARSLAGSRGLQLAVSGSGDFVHEQNPPANGKVAPGSTIAIKLSRQPEGEHATIPMPDLRGLTLRQAAAYLRKSRVKVNASGNGIVRSQLPLPGETLVCGGTCTLQCEPSRQLSTIIY
jgi:cell division protein FtsI/penicillin-binding protein 2